MTTQQKLSAIYKRTDEIIDMLTASRPIDTALEAINWAALRCDEARFVSTNFNDEYFEVIVSGASPYSANLRAHIQVALRREFPRAIFGEIDVVAER